MSCEFLQTKRPDVTVSRDDHVGLLGGPECFMKNYGLHGVEMEYWRECQDVASLKERRGAYMASRGSRVE